MKVWQAVTVENLVTAVAYASISYIILSGLAKTGQLRSNKLGLATGLIFLTCAVHHGSHSVHMTDLLGEHHSDSEFGPGDLRRSVGTAVADDGQESG